jgi:hypothetical protein
MGTLTHSLNPFRAIIPGMAHHHFHGNDDPESFAVLCSIDSLDRRSHQGVSQLVMVSSH